MILLSEIEKDVDLILWSIQASGIIRYMDQFHWQDETKRTREALAIDRRHANGTSVPRSESVADHSWHMADIAMLLAPRFPELDLKRCLELAIIHDKLEIIMGDYDPMGTDGTGQNAHAFNADKKKDKDAVERQAMQTYLAKVHAAARAHQADLLSDVIEVRTPESHFVKALDRLQPLAYIILRKNGVMTDAHLEFSLRHLLTTCCTHFPPLLPYFDHMIRLLLQSIADERRVTLDSLYQQFRDVMAQAVAA
jgi:5'-deoxynucleotidase YfbR-like HD superfamily hydrolase